LGGRGGLGLPIGVNVNYIKYISFTTQIKKKHRQNRIAIDDIRVPIIIMIVGSVMQNLPVAELCEALFQNLAEQ
jgi:hypothetical protein